LSFEFQSPQIIERRSNRLVTLLTKSLF